MLVLVVVLVWNVFRMQQVSAKVQTYSFSDLHKHVMSGDVQSVIINGADVQGELRNGKGSFRATVQPNYPDLYKELLDHDVKVDVRDNSGYSWLSILIYISPFLLIVAFYFIILRQMQSGGNKAMSFGKSRARMLNMQQKKVTFKDVAGANEAKDELKEIIEFLREAPKFQKLGARIPKGVLLVGPPGTGKTLLARAVAGEANVPFFSISGSDFVEMFVGVGASRVRDLFDQGKKNAPCIIFIDEIDAVGRHRGAGLGGGHDEREQTLNQLLVEMDGFESNDGVILIAATNRPDVLDPALLRPGRFDRRVVVALPDVRGREEILKVHTRKTPLNDDVDLSIISRGCPGFSGADLANLVNEAAISAAHNNRKSVNMDDFEVSKDKVMMGAERKSLLLSDQEKHDTAYHEAGHALVAAKSPSADPLHKVTIIPRDMSLGLTMQLPVDDKHSYNSIYLETRLAISLGGLVAEQIFLEATTTGVSNDIERATTLARRMVCEWGMSPLGPLTFGKKEEQIFLGRELSQHRDYSEETANKIDAEVRRYIENAYNRAKAIIEGNREALIAIANALLEREVIDAADIKALLEGREMPAKHTDSGNSGSTPNVDAETKDVSGDGGEPEGSPA